MTATTTEAAVEHASGPGVGRVARVIGPVVDIEFPSDQIPEIYNALKVDIDLSAQGEGEAAGVTTMTLEVVEGVAPAGKHDVLPLYEFEPSPEAVLDALLPMYVRSRIYTCLLQAAASELAARQRAMHTATENAEDLVRMYTRLANQARQAEITQEISEIVSGADALAS